jgi:hypothetical protein
MEESEAIQTIRELNKKIGALERENHRLMGALNRSLFRNLALQGVSVQLAEPGPNGTRLRIVGQVGGEKL